MKLTLKCPLCGNRDVILKAFWAADVHTGNGTELAIRFTYLCPCSAEEHNSFCTLSYLLGVHTFLEAKLEN